MFNLFWKSQLLIIINMNGAIKVQGIKKLEKTHKIISNDKPHELSITIASQYMMAKALCQPGLVNNVTPILLYNKIKFLKKSMKNIGGPRYNGHVRVNFD